MRDHMKPVVCLAREATPWASDYRREMLLRVLIFVNTVIKVTKKHIKDSLGSHTRENDSLELCFRASS
jgi:hypothetical protein